MARKDIVVIGASAGGMDALRQLARELPRGLNAALFLVWHLAPGYRSVLPEVLSRSGPLPALHPRDGDPIEPGRIYVAPPDHHLLLERGYVRVTKGPKENRFRPAIDPLFRSAAYVYGARSIGVVLSGALDDGTAGLWTIKLRGGTAIVQDPADATHRSMPLSALENVAIDHKLAAADIGRLLAGLVWEEAPADPPIAERELARIEREVRIAQGVSALEEPVMPFGEFSAFTCPECHGTLTRLREGSIARFRCHTGHGFSAGTLLDGVTSQVEERLWDVVRALDEAVMLLNEMGDALAKQGRLEAAERCFDRAREAYERSLPLREAATAGDALDPEPTR
jgi:two-component system chemotaxis response regulator CheB